MTLEVFQPYAEYFVPAIPRTPTNRYASIIMVRETKSYAIFTTEGGERQDTEDVRAGIAHGERISRLVVFKRKQVAAERRTGKALLRQYGVFPFAVLYKDGKPQAIARDDETIAAAQEKAKGKGWSLDGPYADCYLTEGLCTHCPDCLTYGYAAIEGQGARRARVMTDTCFSVRPYEIIQKRVKFNVIDEVEHTSGTITEYDYTTPGVLLPAVETTVDLTVSEFTYVLGNVLRTTRYGKEGSRQGFVRNHVLGIAFSDVELFANLEFAQGLYDAFVDCAKLDLAHEMLTLEHFEKQGVEVVKHLTGGAAGRVKLVTGDELGRILQGVRELNQNDKELGSFLRGLAEQAASFVV